MLPVLQAARAALQARERAERAEFEVCRDGRALGLSWDTLAGYLGVPGETLRRRHSARC